MINKIMTISEIDERIKEIEKEMEELKELKKDKYYMRHVNELNEKQHDKCYFYEERYMFDLFITELLYDLYEEYRVEVIIELMETTVHYEKEYLSKDSVFNKRVRKKYESIFECLKQKAIFNATNGKTRSVSKNDHIIVTKNEVKKAKSLLQKELKCWIKKFVQHL